MLVLCRAHSQIVGGLSRGENGHLLHFSPHKGGRHTICSAKNARPGHFSLEKALPTIWECARRTYPIKSYL
jgi:hypothetical protein